MSGSSPQLENEIVRAGAGAGKTTELVRRVLSLAEHWRQQTRSWPRLIVTTFTKKATQELRERLTVEACRRGDLELLDFCRSSGRLHISTIHGVLSLFLRRYGHLAGVDPTFKILDEASLQIWRRKILRDCLMAHPASGQLLEWWSVERMEKILKQLSSWTRSFASLPPLTVKDQRLQAVQQFCLWQKILQDLSQDIQRQTENEKWKAYSQYLDGLNIILLKFVNSDPETSNPKLDFFLFQELQRYVEDWPHKPPKRKGESLIGMELDDHVASVAKDMKAQIHHPNMNPKNWLLFEQRAQQFDILLKNFNERWQDLKSHQSILEMEDLELKTREIVHQESGLAQAFSADWDYWLIDEFQDTSPLQVEILDSLIGEKSQYIVGDPQQSIYLFRGAELGVFEEREQKIKLKGQSRDLRINYRARPDLLTFLNDFFGSLDSGFRTMIPYEEPSGDLRVVATFAGHTDETSPEPQSELKYNQKQGRRHSEYKGILTHITRLLHQPEAQLSHICILARRNRTLLEMAQFLKEQGLPTRVHASRGFQERREVGDALAILKFLVHPFDDQNIIEILRSPWCRIPDENIIQNLKPSGAPLWLQLQDSELGQHFVIQNLQHLRVMTQNFGYGFVWEKALIDFGFFDFSSHHDATGRREANLWKLLTQFRQAERTPGFKILEFVNQGSFHEGNDLGGHQDGDAVTALEPNAINLMTVHAAKGLQNKHIILPHCDEVPRPGRTQEVVLVKGLNPVWSVKVPMGEFNQMEASLPALLAQNQQRKQELKEQERLLYVALTRAQESLYLSWTGEPQEGSWLKMWNWPCYEEGVWSRQHYQFEVLKGHSLQDFSTFKTETIVTSPRSLWREFPEDSKRFNFEDSVSVSQVLRQESENKTNFIESSENNPLHSLHLALKGTELHQWFEQLHLNPHLSWVDFFQDVSLSDRQSLQKAAEYILHLKNPPMPTLLKVGKAEWGFKVLQDQRVLEGKIDLWGLVDGEIWVIDYKTGATLSVERAFHQLSLYAGALRQFGYKDPIKMAVLYPFKQKEFIKNWEGK